MSKKSKRRMKERMKEQRIVSAEAYLAKVRRSQGQLSHAEQKEFDRLAAEKRRIDKLIEQREARLAREERDATDANQVWHAHETGKYWSNGRWHKIPKNDFPNYKPVSTPRAANANRRLYFAYGSNLNRAQMRLRCGGSTMLYAHSLQGFKLEFQRHANIVEASEEDFVPGAIFLISPKDEEWLDRFEGVRHGIYEKKTFKFFTPKGNWRDVLYYQKRPGKLVPPSKDYLHKIVEGYKALNYDFTKLNEAIIEANEAYEKREKKRQTEEAKKPKATVETTVRKVYETTSAPYDKSWVDLIKLNDFDSAELEIMLKDPIWEWSPHERRTLEKIARKKEDEEIDDGEEDEE